MNRDRYVDFLRAWAIGAVVFGHWLITGLVRGDGGEIRAPELLAEMPWTQWLTLLFQVMPLFFFAGGHAAGGSWERHRDAGGRAAGWVGLRALRLLLPTGVYCGVVLVAVGVSAAVGVDPYTLALVGWALAMQFWFLPVYLVLSALTPVLHAAHRRWGVFVPVALGAAALVTGALGVGLLNHVLVWGVAYQLGFCRRDGLLGGRPLGAAAMAAGGGLAFALLVGPGPYPVSLILVTGQDPSNTNPPSAAMLAWVVAQVGVCLLLAPPLRRVLARERLWRRVRVVSGVSMTLYLWHMVPVLVVAAVLYLPGLAPEPGFGSPAWWAWRVPWLLVLGGVLAGLVVGLRPLERGVGAVYARVGPRARPGWSWALWLGLVACVAALSRFAVRGFAPDGRLPVAPTVGVGLGIALVVLSGWRTDVRRERSAKSALDEVA
ncbi:acyltransferase family protein [Streptomyces resistomycificus]|uniref:acyltransferase family protein n=2 Tax=Streptomyces resistomycificus TaxID=67356 RepID=UPI00069CE0C4|nr:acyltransferase [Streptomyces resistomycificus]KUN98775.1 hypothetical protein AQJ84_14095 [Streptomyces resistomycificus]